MSEKPVDYNKIDPLILSAIAYSENRKCALEAISYLVYRTGAVHLKRVFALCLDKELKRALGKK